MKKTIASVIFLTVVVHASLFALCAPTLMYEEGWGTFYWDWHYLSDTLCQEGLPETLRLFVLQFFADAATGVSVMTILMSHVSALMIAGICFFFRKKLYLFLTLIPSALFSLGVIDLTSPNGLSALSSRFTLKSRQSSQYMELSNRARENDWDGIIALCDESGRITNLLTQNFLNMALAEKGQLGDKLFDEPCHDIRSIYIDVIKEQDFAALLSDIYYSMGHIAQSQRYAFELNEKENNMSPRLLKRLVQTNIIYGQYAVAEKYLKWLKATIYYKEWAESQERFLYRDDLVAKDAEYGVKRSCLIADNRFSGIRGLDDDLLHVARQTRGTVQCRTTLQYLASLYLLAHYDRHFVSLCREFPEYKLTQQKYFSESYNVLVKETGNLTGNSIK